MQTEIEETAENLESLAPECLAAWYRTMGQSALYSAAPLVLGVILIYLQFTVFSATLEGPMGNAVKPGLLICVIGIIWGFFMLSKLTARAFRGLPKAGESAQETIKRYYGSCLNGEYVDGFVCLLDAAKKKFGSWQDFTAYWAREASQVDTKNLGRATTPWTVQSIKIFRDGEEGATSSFEIVRTYKPGLFRVQLRRGIQRVGARWYLTDGSWETLGYPAATSGAMSAESPTLSEPYTTASREPKPVPEGYTEGRGRLRTNVRVFHPSEGEGTVVGPGRTATSLECFWTIQEKRR
jgi:hypothetical protein